jgi:tetratricopeptide (TPR) repeat protein
MFHGLAVCYFRAIIFARKFSEMNIRLTVAAMALLFLASCGAKMKWEADKISKQENALLEAAKGGKIDSIAVNNLLAAYEAFADKYPGDTTAANFLFKAADFYRYMGKPLKSIGIYEKIYHNYPNFDKRPYALFLQGFMFENEVGNTEAAKIKYREFLKAFPEHAIAKDVKLTLENLGKTPEQLLAEFEAMQQADSTAQTKGE